MLGRLDESESKSQRPGLGLELLELPCPRDSL